MCEKERQTASDEENSWTGTACGARTRCRCLSLRFPGSLAAHEWHVMRVVVCIVIEIMVVSVYLVTKKLMVAVVVVCIVIEVTVAVVFIMVASSSLHNHRSNGT